MTLTKVQQDHVDGTFYKSRAEMADLLIRGVDVIVYRQDECQSVPGWAVSPKDDHEFWIGCWDTDESARLAAAGLGLEVVS